MLALSRTTRVERGFTRALSSMQGFGFDMLGPEVVGDGANRTSIRAIGDQSFLVNNVQVKGSVVLFPSSFMMWTPKRMEDITVESLACLELVYPTPEIVFIGCGDKMKNRLSLDIVDHFRKKGIVLEATNSSSAASTFNILNAEGRNVAAALLSRFPTNDVNLDESD